jgi:hypothetical protein
MQFYKDGFRGGNPDVKQAAPHTSPRRGVDVEVGRVGGQDRPRPRMRVAEEGMTHVTAQDFVFLARRWSILVSSEGQFVVSPDIQRE